MFNVRLAGGHLYGKQLFTWLSLVVSLMASFVLSFFPLGVLGGIWDVGSVSEGFLTYSYMGGIWDVESVSEGFLTYSYMYFIALKCYGVGLQVLTKLVKALPLSYSPPVILS